MKVKCSRCGLEFEALPLGVPELVKICEPMPSDDPATPRAVFGIGHVDKMVCANFTCRGKLEPVKDA